MQLCFDARFIRPGNPDGISRFSLGLIFELAKKCDLTLLVCNKEVASRMPAGVKLVWLNEPTSPLEPLTALRLNRHGIKVLFSPMQTTSGLGRKFKLILTLHDLIYYRHRTPPRDFNWLIRLGWWLFHLTYWPQRFLLNGADAVATVSETSKNQILRHKLTRRPVTVIHNAAEPAESSDTKSRHDSKHLVYMGSFIGYKNVETLVRGMHYLPDHTLVLLSRASAEVRMQLELLATEVGAKIEFAQGVTDEQYHQWLISAKALVTASLDEGFGLPLVEAMERGCPIVVSNLEIFQEVGGEAALFFEATNPKDFADQVLKLENEQFWLEKSKLSLLQSKHFSWERSAQELISLAKSLGA